jgi:predicted hydrocarbon binding protein/predicted amino acid-binding ACT domain protein
MVVITISGADKSGSLARISTFFVRKGYPIKGQQMTESASGAKLVKISLDITHLDKVKLADEIKNLGPEFRVVSVEGAQSAAAAPSIKEISAQFPDIAPLVQAYGESFGSETRDQELVVAGKKIGAFQYEKEWSFGSPLKMPVALRRTLVPALEAFGKVDATDTEVVLPDSPFCSTGKISCCEFLSGFMQGFLDAGPLTQNTRVQKAACRAKGDSRCAYTFSYDL